MRLRRITNPSQRVHWYPKERQAIPCATANRGANWTRVQTEVTCGLCQRLLVRALALEQALRTIAGDDGKDADVHA